jgi:hypothetical protein
LLPNELSSFLESISAVSIFLANIFFGRRADILELLLN